MPKTLCRPAVLACAAFLLAMPARASVTPPQPAAIPVTVQPATRANIPVYAYGIGTVVPINSALIRARVDGTLDSVHFTEGQRVNDGDLLAVIDPRPYQAVLDQAVAKKNQDLANLANQRRDLGRYRTLAGIGFAPQQQADTQSALVQSGQALIAADDAAIEAARLNLSFTHITSPIAGRAGLRLLNPGNLVHATDAGGIVTVTQISPITVEFTLPEEDVTRVQEAMRAGPVPVDVLTSDKTRVLDRGTLLTIDNTIDTATGTISLKAQFANAAETLWPGAFVEARIRLGGLDRVVSVPAAAVQRGQDGLYVFLVGPGNQAVERRVTEYQEQDGVAAIASGLADGDQVVVDGLARVSNGAVLAVQQARS